MGNVFGKAIITVNTKKGKYMYFKYNKTLEITFG